MKYVGGKHLIGFELSDFLNSICDIEDVDGYLEPFCGSLGVFKFMCDFDYKKMIASDLHPDLIALWKAVKDNSLKYPKSINEKTYNKYKNMKSPDPLKALIGFGCSFGGDFFSSFSQKYAGDSGRNFYQETLRSIAKIKEDISKPSVKFYRKKYSDFNPKNMLVYCDPPYQFTTGYSTGSFDHDKFWDTMREWSKNNYVFISEEQAPKDFVVIWEKKKFRSLGKNNRTHKVEKVFVHKSSLNKIKKLYKKNKNKIVESESSSESSEYTK